MKLLALPEVGADEPEGTAGDRDPLHPAVDLGPRRRRRTSTAGIERSGFRPWVADSPVPGVPGDPSAGWLGRSRPKPIPTQPPLTFAGGDRGERARGIEPPSLAWEANVLAIGQRPRGSGVYRTRIPFRRAHARLLAGHARRRGARRAAGLRGRVARARTRRSTRRWPRASASRRRVEDAAAARRRRAPARSPTTRARSSC